MRLLLGLLVVLALGVGALLFFLDRLVGGAIELAGERALGVRTHVGLVTLRPIAGRFGLTSLEVSNPAGFESPYFLRLGDVRLHMPLGALRGDPIVIERLELVGLDLHLERSGRDTNYGRILGSSGSGPEASAESTPVVVRELVIREGRAHVMLAPGREPLVVELPELVLRDVGGGEGGLPRSELVSLVTRTVLVGVLRRGAALPPELRSELGAQLARVPLRDVTRRLEESASEALGRAGESAGRLLRGFLGNGSGEER